METSLEKITVGLTKYCTIMGKLYTTDVSIDREFQKLYNGYYRIRQRPQSFYSCYYNFLEENKHNFSLTFEQVLHYLLRNTGCIHASFSSKLLATVRPELPVWDKHVLHNLNLKPPSYSSKNRFEETVALYQQICNWYKTDLALEKVAEFDKYFHNVPISDTKKVDFILWQTR